MGEHTKTPWKAEMIYSQINGELVEISISSPDFDIAFIELDEDDADVQKANAAFIVKAVNNHRSLVDKLGKIVAWLERIATAAERSSVTCRFESMRAAYDADAKNYRKTIADILPVLEAARSAPPVRSQRSGL